MIIFISVLLFIIIVLVITNLRIVSQSEAYVVERLGAYKETWDVGIHIKTPFIDRIVNKVNLKEIAIDYAPQNCITKNNVNVKVDSVIFIKIMNPEYYTYGVEEPEIALKNLAITTLRSVIGSMELDDTLSARVEINMKMQYALDEATDPWGIKVMRVEIKDITPPMTVQETMLSQITAEKKKTASVQEAEGIKESAIRVAEGEKQAAIMKAEAERASANLKAEAIIKLAEAEATAIRLKQQAIADGLNSINNVDLNEGTLRIKGYEAFEKIADGQSTKVIIPSDLQNVAGFISTIKEI